MKKSVFSRILFTFIITALLLTAMSIAVFAEENNAVESLQVNGEQMNLLKLSPEELTAIEKTEANKAPENSQPAMDRKQATGMDSIAASEEPAAEDTSSPVKDQEPLPVTKCLPRLQELQMDSKADSAESKTITAPLEAWERYAGYSQSDAFYSLAKLNDGSFAAVGVSAYTGSDTAHFGGKDIYIVRYNASGTVLDEVRFGSIYDEWANSVQATADGGYILTGCKINSLGGQDVILTKFNVLDTVIWSSIFDSGYNDYGNAVIQTSDGGYAIAGQGGFSSSDKDVWLIKTDSYGLKVWDYKYGGTGFDLGLDIKQTTDGGYIVTGDTSPYGSNLTDVYVVKTNYGGTKQWGSIFDFYGLNDYGEAVLQKSDGGYAITGQLGYSSSNNEVLLLDINSLGQFNWDWGYGLGYNSGNSIIKTTDGGYLIGGSFMSSLTSYSDAYLIKTDSNGNSQWVKLVGGTSSDLVNSIVQANDGGYVAAGATSSYGYGGSDGFIFKLNPESAGTPVVTGTDPLNGAINLPLSEVVKITFDRTIQTGTAYSSITLKDSSNNAVTFTPSISGSVLTITPSSLNYGKTYTVTVPANAVMDTSGNGFAGGTTLTFSTLPLINPPQVLSTDPANGATNVSISKAVTVTFDKTIQAGTTYSSITLKDGSNNAVTFTPGISGSVLTITPSQVLGYAKTYTLTIPANAVKDTSGNGFAGGSTISFTTQSDPGTVKLGDVNSDGVVDIKDALLVLKYDAGLITLTDSQKTSGNVNRDSATDIKDAVLILKFDAGIIIGF